VDPERDTLAALREYADRYSATADGWWFLRGPQADVLALEYGGFKMGDPKDAMIHSARFVLVDGAGRIRGWYRGTEAEEVTRLLADVRRLREERP
jgi:protein SCO1/2